MKKQTGYTLFELITLISIIGIFAATIFVFAECSSAVSSGELAREIGEQVKHFDDGRKQ